MKLVASSLKCISNTQGEWHLPSAGGGTALVDGLEAVLQRVGGSASEGEKLRVIIVSDGEDTMSCKEKLLSANGEVSDWRGAERNAKVAEHLSFLLPVIVRAKRRGSWPG